MRIALITALSLLAVTPAFATEGPGSPTDGTSHAELTIDSRSTVPADGFGDGTGRPLVIDLHRMFAGDGGPTGAGDHNGRAELTTDTHQMFAGDGGPGTAGDHNGHAELTTEPLLIVAGCRGGLGGEV
jgi:hypothetical protein